MSKTFSLQALVNLAQQKNETATRKFGQLNQQQQAQQAKLDTLLQYRNDYQLQLQESVQQGMNQADFCNFQDFIKRLDDAIEQQRVATENARGQVQQGRIDLIEAQRKMKSFDTLAQRHIDSENKLVEKIEQRQQDEHNSRASAIKAANTQNDS